ncbi:hypothetical protein Mal48_14930 [Thalassoglobus polymorphus]|uniref:Uncharacterized protein n=1 Tax=Thalassoglobus polymorphus TaxID=2527994 RepID=A0A517QKT1_9PLAN|nr:hypothetical protein Mal48_14930 [Thalassoglobus polymorphus]
MEQVSQNNCWSSLANEKNSKKNAGKYKNSDNFADLLEFIQKHRNAVALNTLVTTDMLRETVTSTVASRDWIEFLISFFCNI